MPGHTADYFFLFFTLVTGPRRSLSLKLSDTKVYEPEIRAKRSTKEGWLATCKAGIKVVTRGNFRARRFVFVVLNECAVPVRHNVSCFSGLKVKQTCN